MWLLLLLPTWSHVGVEGFGVHTEFGQDYEAFCPKKHFVSRFEIHKGKTKEGHKDIRFFFKCNKFTRTKKLDREDKGWEYCKLKQRFPLPHGVLMMDNHWKSCSCDEYLAGLKSYTYRRVRKGRKVQRLRMVQMRCCYASNKHQNVSSCYFSGMQSLRGPWETKIRVRRRKDPKEAIQGISITEDYINARICAWLVKPIHTKQIVQKVNKCSGVRKRSRKSMKAVLRRYRGGRCLFPVGNPFWWSENTNSRATEKGIALNHHRLYEKQMHMCRDGNFLYALYKFARTGKRGKDYVFKARCHEITFEACHCVWKQNCTHPENRKKRNHYGLTYYVAGWRSRWHWRKKRRTMEVFCCLSKGLEMVSCNTTRTFGDKDTQLVINRPRYKWDAMLRPRIIDGEIIRDIDQWQIAGSLMLRFNVCQVRGTGREMCARECQDCTGIGIGYDAAFLAPIPVYPCVPPKIMGLLNVTTTTSSTTTTSGTTSTSTTVTTSTPTTVTTSSTTTVTTTTSVTTTSTASTTTTTTTQDCSPETTETETTDACVTVGACGCMEFCEAAYGLRLVSFICIDPDQSVCTCTIKDVGCTSPPLVDSCACNNNFDFSFMLDRSGSVELTRFGGLPGNFQKMINFFTGIAHEFRIDDGNTRVSAVSYAYEALLEFGFDDITQDSASVTAAMNAIQYTTGGTHISDALETAKPIFAATKRPGIPQVVILATDGRHNQDGPLPAVVAEELRAMGIYLVMVGIGDVMNLDLPQLEQTAGTPDGTTATDRPDWVHLLDFATMEGRAKEITESLCTDINAAELNNPTKK